MARSERSLLRLLTDNFFKDFSCLFSYNLVSSVIAKVNDEIIRTKSEEIKKEMEMDKNRSEIFGGQKDLLHLLLRSNMDPSLKPSERMSHEICRSQIQFFMFAGHETSGEFK